MALEAIQAQAGHASIETTRIYLHLADGWLAEEYRRAAEAIDAQTDPTGRRPPMSRSPRRPARSRTWSPPTAPTCSRPGMFAGAPGHLPGPLVPDPGRRRRLGPLSPAEQCATAAEGPPGGRLADGHRPAAARRPDYLVLGQPYLGEVAARASPGVPRTVHRDLRRTRLRPHVGRLQWSALAKVAALAGSRPTG